MPSRSNRDRTLQRSLAGGQGASSDQQMMLLWLLQQMLQGQQPRAVRQPVLEQQGGGNPFAWMDTEGTYEERKALDEAKQLMDKGASPTYEMIRGPQGVNPFVEQGSRELSPADVEQLGGQRAPAYDVEAAMNAQQAAQPDMAQLLSMMQAMQGGAAAGPVAPSGPGRPGQNQVITAEVPPGTTGVESDTRFGQGNLPANDLVSPMKYQYLQSGQTPKRGANPTLNALFASAMGVSQAPPNIPTSTVTATGPANQATGQPQDSTESAYDAYTGRARFTTEEDVNAGIERLKRIGEGLSKEKKVREIVDLQNKINEYRKSKNLDPNPEFKDYAFLMMMDTDSLEKYAKRILEKE